MGVVHAPAAPRAATAAQNIQSAKSSQGVNITLSYRNVSVERARERVYRPNNEHRRTITIIDLIIKKAVRVRTFKLAVPRSERHTNFRRRPSKQWAEDRKRERKGTKKKKSRGHIHETHLFGQSDRFFFFLIRPKCFWTKV